MLQAMNHPQVCQIAGVFVSGISPHCSTPDEPDSLPVNYLLGVRFQEIRANFSRNFAERVLFCTLCFLLLDCMRMTQTGLKQSDESFEFECNCFPAVELVNQQDRQFYGLTQTYVIVITETFEMNRIHCGKVSRDGNNCA